MLWREQRSVEDICATLAREGHNTWSGEPIDESQVAEAIRHLASKQSVRPPPPAVAGPTEEEHRAAVKKITRDANIVFVGAIVGIFCCGILLGPIAILEGLMINHRSRKLTGEMSSTAIGAVIFGVIATLAGGYNVAKRYVAYQRALGVAERAEANPFESGTYRFGTPANVRNTCGRDL